MEAQPGSSSDPRTALVIPVPEAASYAADAAIALLDPFLPPTEVDEGVLAELRELFGALVPFAFTLGEQARFPSGTAYLPPRPAVPFRRVTHELRRAFPEVVGTTTTLETFVPHLRVPDDAVVTRVLAAHARECQLREVGPDGTSQVRATFPFGTSAA